MVVCSPQVMAGPYPLDTYAALSRHPLIQHSDPPECLEPLVPLRRLRAEQSPLGTEPGTLLHGHSSRDRRDRLALLPRFLIDDEIERGMLVVPFQFEVSGPGAYYVVTPNAKAELPRINSFRGWIIREALHG